MENKVKNKQVLDVLNGLDISNLKGKTPAVQSEPQVFPDINEPGISPEEARRRRELLFQAPPSVIKQQEEQVNAQQSADEPVPTGNILDMSLDDLKMLMQKGKKSSQPGPVGDEDEQVVEPQLITGRQ